MHVCLTPPPPPDKVAVTDKDRMLSLKYHSTDQANQLTGSHSEGVAAQDYRYYVWAVIL